jgi:hypothetical protein
VVLPYVLTDADGNPTWIEVEVAVNGGSFAPITLSSEGDPAFGVASSPTGRDHVLAWDSMAALGPGTHAVTLRLRARDVAPGPWTTVSFTVSN